MHIHIESDATLPVHCLYVSSDLDDELLAVLEASRFQICVDRGQPPQSIRMSAHLADRIETWQTLQSILPTDRYPER